MYIHIHIKIHGSIHYIICGFKKIKGEQKAQILVFFFFFELLCDCASSYVEKRSLLFELISLQKQGIYCMGTFFLALN